MSPARILVVEDEAIVAEDLRDLLQELRYKVAAVVPSGHEAIAKAVELRPDLVLMDIKLTGAMDGIEAAVKIREQTGIPLVFLTAFADRRTLERAKTACPYGYLVKPFDQRTLRATIEVAMNRYREERRPTVSVSEESALKHDSSHGLIGASSAMRSVFDEISRLARVDSTVLIEGETGTGKERVARAICKAGVRAGKAFFTVNCAALIETLAASELFGHRRGAFTGAVDNHSGVFEAAGGGTVFLDEIGDIPKSQQPFLLRVLEEREVTRVGETTPRKIDVRVLAASNRSLDAEVAAGRFRSDLFYRIRVAHVIVPPLRERAGDVSLLAKRFLSQICEKSRSAPHAISEEALHALSSYPWPGNVREVKNAIEFAAIRCAGGIIQRADLPPEIIAAHAPVVGALKNLPAGEGKARMLDALARANLNRTEAARLLGISRATLYRRLNEFGISGGEE
jgi:DNA-binding NtrC family response regulator